MSSELFNGGILNQTNWESLQPYLIQNNRLMAHTWFRPWKILNDNQLAGGSSIPRTIFLARNLAAFSSAGGVVEPIK